MNPVRGCAQASTPNSAAAAAASALNYNSYSRGSVLTYLLTSGGSTTAVCLAGRACSRDKLLPTGYTIHILLNDLGNGTDFYNIEK